MDTNAVALASIGLASSTVLGLVWVVKYFANTLSNDLKEHTKAAIAQTAASQEQKKASEEVLTFMKALNGRLTVITAQKIQEQKVAHQTVERVEHVK